MTIELPSLEEIIRITKTSLMDKFPLFMESHMVNAQNMGSSIWVGYSDMDFTPKGRTGTNFDLNFFNSLCYITGIQLIQEERGRGLGWKLYEAVAG